MEQQSDIGARGIYAPISRVSTTSPNQGWRAAPDSPKNPAVNPALDTLMLAFSSGEVPERVLFIGAEPDPDLPLSVMGWQPLKPKADAWDLRGLRFNGMAIRWPRWRCALS